MKGVRFVTDDDGKRVAVLLDLEEWGDVWEDVYDSMVAASRASEASESLDEFEAALRDDGLLNE
ncbi:MAG TPA: hypothetical protein VF698_07930 [Thermoanaerobaculia bacterium]|jgi:hypothetical protein